MINLNKVKEKFKLELLLLINEYLNRIAKNQDGHHEHVQLIDSLKTIATMIAAGVQAGSMFPVLGHAAGLALGLVAGPCIVGGTEIQNYRKNYKRDNAGKIFRFFSPAREAQEDLLDQIINKIFADRSDLLAKVKDTARNTDAIAKFFAANVMKVIKENNLSNGLSTEENVEIISNYLGKVLSRKVSSQKLEMEDNGEILTLKKLALKNGG